MIEWLIFNWPKKNKSLKNTRRLGPICQVISLNSLDLGFLLFYKRAIAIKTGRSRLYISSFWIKDNTDYEINIKMANLI
jgi:hypothetical protein